MRTMERHLVLAGCQKSILLEISKKDTRQHRATTTLPEPDYNYHRNYHGALENSQTG